MYSKKYVTIDYYDNVKNIIQGNGAILEVALVFKSLVLYELITQDFSYKSDQ